jgi:preprotein translocase subunit SecD
VRKGLAWSLIGSILVAFAALGITLGVGHAPLLGLDLRGGLEVVLRPHGTVDAATLQQAVDIIERRVNGLGVSNSSVQRQGSDVTIELPGIKDPQRALSELGQTAELLFRPVYCAVPNYSASAAKTATKVPITSSVALTAAQAQSACTYADGAALPSTPVANDSAANAVILPMYDGSERWILGPADLKGNVVKNAIVVAPGGNGNLQYQVQVTFTKAGSSAFDKIAAQRFPYYSASSSTPNPKSQEAIELDGQVESVPQIEAAAFHGTAVISGGTTGFTQAQANRLALELRYGGLPVRFTPQSVQTVTATIGKDSLRAGLLAGVGGLLVVLLYMIFYYRALGLVVVLGLAIGGSALYSIITELSQSANLTLTLSGVTGIIVSIGITVDSYVVYFERLKDEIRAGRTIRQSVERGFHRAFRTVLTADFVTFLAALILYLLTVGDVKGFAFMLGLSTLLDVVTAYFFIRPAVILVGRQRAFTDARFIGVARGLGAVRSAA